MLVVVIGIIARAKGGLGEDELITAYSRRTKHERALNIDRSTVVV